MRKLLMNTQFINCFLQENKISKNAFAKLCNLEYKILKDIYKQKNISAFYIINIVKILNISADTFLFMPVKRKKTNH